MVDLQGIVDDLQPQQREALAIIARRMAERGRQGFTGSDVIEINYSQGGQSAVYCTSREALLVTPRKRQARNGGIG